MTRKESGYMVAERGAGIPRRYNLLQLDTALKSFPARRGI
jgi:hypothetical protein